MPDELQQDNELVGQFQAGFARRGFAEKYAASQGVVEGGKIPKVKAGYKPAFGAARCANCDHFKQGGRCTIVEGQVEAADVCDYFEPTRRNLTGEATERYAREHAADLAKYAEQPSDKLSPEKAKEMLADGTAHGHPLTAAQKGMLGAAVGRGEGK